MWRLTYLFAVLRVVQYAGLNRLSRVSASDYPGFDIVEYAGAGGNHCAIADSNAQRNKHIGSDPDPLAEGDWRGGQRHGRGGVIVAGGAKKTVLADYRIRPNVDLIDAVTIHIRS